MHNVTDDEIEFILNDITKKGVLIEDVRYNILDHVCCIIENELPIGGNFKEFYENTIARFYKKELSEIQRETENLLTFKYYFAMKRTLKTSGFISIFLIIIGSILKTQHLPGAGITLVLGFACFSFLFIPLNIIMNFRDDKEKKGKFVMTFGLLITISGTIGLLFKVMHWPFASILFYGSLAVFGLIFIPLYFFTRFRNPETKFNAVVQTTFMIAAAGMLFTLIDLRPSYHIIESVESYNLYQLTNIAEVKEANKAIYIDSENSKKLRESTTQIDKKIEEIRNNLIEKSNGHKPEDRNGSSLKETRNPNDVNVVVDYFQISEDANSYNALETEINNYNAVLESLENTTSLRKIDISKLQMNNTVLSVILIDLTDIQLQVAMNENSYLSLQQGKLELK